MVSFAEHKSARLELQALLPVFVARAHFRLAQGLTVSRAPGEHRLRQVRRGCVPPEDTRLAEAASERAQTLRFAVLTTQPECAKALRHLLEKS